VRAGDDAHNCAGLPVDQPVWEVRDEDAAGAVFVWLANARELRDHREGLLEARSEVDGLLDAAETIELLGFDDLRARFVLKLNLRWQE
jgi:hypothetical protein